MGLGILDVLGSISGGVADASVANAKRSGLRATAEASAEEERRKRRIEDFKLRKSIIDPTDTVAMQELTEQFSDLFGVGSSVIVDESFKRAKADQEKSAEESRRIKEENAFVAKNSTPTTLLDDLVDPGEQERQRELYNPSGLGVGVSGSFQRAKDRNRGVQDEARLLQGMGQGINTEGSISDAELRKLYSEGADGGVQNFANIQQNQSDQLKRQVGNAKANEISKVIEKISELDNMENAKALLARAKALGAIDNAVVPIQAKIDAGFDEPIDEVPVGERPLTRLQMFKAEDDLIKNYIERSERMSDAQSNMAKVQRLSSDKTGFSDMALVFAFMKMHDPTSVVKETEFGLVEATGPISLMGQRVIENFNTGRRLTDTQREEMLATTKGLYDDEVELNKPILKQFKDRAIKRGVPEDIYPDFYNLPSTASSAAMDAIESELEEVNRQIGEAQ
jgi:hypothetical protein